MPASEHQTPDPASLLLLLQQTRSLLACHLALGLSSYPATPELRQFVARAALPSVPLRPNQMLKEERPSPGQQQSAGQQLSAPSLSEITQQLAGCRRCALAATPLPGQGSSAPKLLVVSGYVDEHTHLNMVLGQGQAEDELFWRMMKAIGLNRETVYVTNVVKCRQQEPLAAERNCLFWLEQELRALQPRLICAMGTTATQMLISKTASLLRLRRQGKLHPCRLPSAPQAQVLATFHPSFLLQQPDIKEVKEATWKDLQILQRRLALS